MIVELSKERSATKLKDPNYGIFFKRIIKYHGPNFRLPGNLSWNQMIDNENENSTGIEQILRMLSQNQMQQHNLKPPRR